MSHKGLGAIEQIEELASYLLEYFPEEIQGESAVEMAIRILSKQRLELNEIGSFRRTK